MGNFKKKITTQKKEGEVSFLVTPHMFTSARDLAEEALQKLNIRPKDAVCICLSLSCFELNVVLHAVSNFGAHICAIADDCPISEIYEYIYKRQPNIIFMSDAFKEHGEYFDFAPVIEEMLKEFRFLKMVIVVPTYRRIAQKKEFVSPDFPFFDRICLWDDFLLLGSFLSQL